MILEIFFRKKIRKEHAKPEKKDAGDFRFPCVSAVVKTGLSGYP
jgi:hypothetical protein